MGNAAAQAAAAQALAGASEQLAAALASSDTELSSRAAAVLEHIVRGNAELRGHLAQQLGAQLAHCTHQLAGLLLSPQLRDLAHEPLPPVARAQALRFIRLALAWLPGCSAAVLAFLQAAIARPFLVGVVSGSQCGDPLVRGLVAVLLGLCATEPRPPQPPTPIAPGNVPTPGMLRNVIATQVRLDAFAGLLGRLGQQLSVAGVGSPSDGGQGGSQVSASFYAYVTALAGQVSLAVTGQPVAVSGTAQPLPYHPHPAPPSPAGAPPPPPFLPASAALRAPQALAPLGTSSNGGAAPSPTLAAYPGTSPLLPPMQRPLAAPPVTWQPGGAPLQLAPSGIVPQEAVPVPVPAPPSCPPAPAAGPGLENGHLSLGAPMTSPQAAR